MYIEGSMIKYICVPWLVTICIVFKRVVLTRIGDTYIQNYSKTNWVIEDKTLIEILGCSMDMVYKIWFLNYKNEKVGAFVQMSLIKFMWWQV